MNRRTTDPLGIPLTSIFYNTARLELGQSAIGAMIRGEPEVVDVE